MALLAVSFLTLQVGGAKAADKPPLKLVVLGDSLTAGYELKSADAFPAQLERALKARGLAVNVVNAGVSGDTASDGLARLDWSVEPDADCVVVELGANDMLRAIDPKVTQAALEQIMARLKARGVPVLVAGMLAPPNLGSDYKGSFDGIFPGLARQSDALLYPFFLDGVAGQPRLQLRDGLHPNAEGVAVMVERILPSVEALVARAAAVRR